LPTLLTGRKGHGSKFYDGQESQKPCYILFELNGDDVGDIGSLEIVWPIDTSWDTLIGNGLSAFTGLYRINYMLYRHEYLRTKSLRRKRD
jgi:hypothetical protein